MTSAELNRRIETVAHELKARYADAASCRASGHVGLAEDSERVARDLEIKKAELVAQLKALK